MTEKESEIRAPGSKTVAKAGIWYTVCNFVFRGMAFITTPIFTRLLTSAELGLFSNMTSWITILVVITSFDLSTSIIRSKLDHENDMDSYILSILSFSTIVTLVAYAIVWKYRVFFSDLFQIETVYIHIIFAYLILSPAYNMLITKHRAFYKYKSFVAMTGLMIVSSLVLSVILVVTMDDRLLGRVLGNYVPPIVISAACYALIVARGKQIKLKYWKYAVTMCLPLVPHLLALNLLGSSSKIIITKFCGESMTAVFAVAFSCYHIVTILFDSMNKAWAPWLLESLHAKNYKEIQKTSQKYVLLFLGITWGVVMMGPELIWILGGKRYADAAFCLPPLAAAAVFQFIYTMYVNIEFYKKKTVGVAGATIIATVVTLALNLVFISNMPEYGHIVASYVTMLGYAFLLVLHYLLVKRLKLAFVYNTGFMFAAGGLTILYCLAMTFLYSYSLIRYALILVFCIVAACIVYKKKDLLLSLIFKRKLQR